MRRVESVAEAARQRLQQLLDEAIRVEAELNRLEDAEFRVCLFGSARLSPEHGTYRDVYLLGRSLAELGVHVVTGGGPGLMEAANRGARDARNQRSKSYGLPIDIPSLVETPNSHLDIKREYRRFSYRLDEFIRLSHAVIVAPGGIGTLLELLYIWQLLQVGLVERRLVILLDGKFWAGLLSWMHGQMLAKMLVAPHDLECIRVVETPTEAVDLVREALHRHSLTRDSLPEVA